MISTGYILLAAISLATPALAAAQEPAPPARADAAAPHPEALAIARLMLPLDQVVEAGMRLGKQAYFEMFRSNAEVAEMESSYPGISAALWPALEPELRRSTIESHPAYLDMVASFYTSRYTPEELRALRILYATPTGMKIMAALYRDTGPDAIIDEIVRSPGGPISQNAADEAFRAKTDRLVATLTREDEAAIRAALRIVPEAKLVRVNGELTKLLVDWLNRPTPELDARIDAVMGEAMDRYMAEHPAKD